jgi:hypothetical protein
MLLNTRVSREYWLNANNNPYMHSYGRGVICGGLPCLSLLTTDKHWQQHSASKPAQLAAPNACRWLGGVYDLIGGEVDHASTDEEGLPDDIKVLRRLAALNLLAAKGWTPTLGFWEVREGRRGTSWEWSLWLLCETPWGVLLLL